MCLKCGKLVDCEYKTRPGMDFPWYVIDESDITWIAKYESEEHACDKRDEILAENPDINVEVWHYNQYQDAIAS
jgi:hypothetical protein